MQEDPACLFAWCDEYTFICTLRGCLLAQMAFAHSVQRQNDGDESHESSKGSRKDGSPATNQCDGSGGSASILQLMAAISQVLEEIGSLASQHGMQPVCQRSVEGVVHLLSQVKKCPNEWQM
jgi:hypothetical protein